MLGIIGHMNISSRSVADQGEFADGVICRLFEPAQDPGFDPNLGANRASLF